MRNRALKNPRVRLDGPVLAMERHLDAVTLKVVWILPDT
jgi:hypothetical protein